MLPRPFTAEFLLSVGASMVAPSMGTTPLDIACSEGNKEVLAELSSRLSELQVSPILCRAVNLSCGPVSVCTPVCLSVRLPVCLCSTV